jgi:predicted hotdog family 3-hydroxylacyl-ACP dehydratase
MPVTGSDFRDLIPHRGTMSLLAEVVRFDEETITCRAVSHRDPAHPLREQGILPALCAIEYAAQAMAVHGALTEPRAPRAGMLAAVRDVALNVGRLDDIADDLLLTARRLMGGHRQILYEFVVHAGGRELLHGRAAVVLAPEVGA